MEKEKITEIFNSNSHNACNVKISLISKYSREGVKVKRADIFTEDTLFSLVVLLRALSFYFYIHAGSAGTVY